MEFTCPLCGNDFELQSGRIYSLCGHRVCTECIRIWVLHKYDSKSCPVCERVKLSTSLFGRRDLMSKMSQYQQEILDALAESFKDRAILGINKYGPDFVGDVVQHLWEESIDTTFYAGRVRQEYGGDIGNLFTKPQTIQVRSTIPVAKNIYTQELMYAMQEAQDVLKAHGLRISKIVLESIDG